MRPLLVTCVGATLTAPLRIQLNSLLLKNLNWHNDCSMWVSKYPHLDLDGNTADTFRKGDKFLPHRRLVVLYQYCAGFAISLNVGYTELKAVWWHPAEFVCCDSNEPVKAVQLYSKAVSRQMVRSEAELAKHGLTRATVCAGTDRLLPDSTWQSGGSENEL